MSYIFDLDNSGPVPNHIIDALGDANNGYQKAYNDDGFMADVQRSLCEVFEALEVAVYPVGAATAANAMALSTLDEPWQTIFYSPAAHLYEYECNVPEIFTSVAKLTLVKCDGKIIWNTCQYGRCKIFAGPGIA